MSSSRLPRAGLGRIAVGVLAVMAVAAGSLAQAPGWSYRELAPRGPGADQRAPGAELGLVLDDGTAEAAFGVTGATSRPFLWFSSFDLPTDPFVLDEIRVLFPEGPAIAPGVPVQLVVFRDDDGDPAAGAELLRTIDETVRVADGATFSVYRLTRPVVLVGGGRALIGVVSRFVEAGVTPPTWPAALDTGASAGRSWVATWVAEPPDPPTLPPDQSLLQVDTLVAGNWMIRGFGRRPVVPTLDAPAIALLVLLLAVLGWRRART